MREIRRNGKNFVDDLGRKVYFHGINICYKGENDALFNKDYKDLWKERRYFDSAVTLEQLEMLSSYGINLIRLGITWDTIEPEMGVYNEENMNRIIEIVRNANKCGIYVLLDMHQDLYAGFGNCFGDGAPKWATLTNGVDYKYPKFVWAEGYFNGGAVMHAFDNFWNNTPVEGIGLQDRFAKMWQYVVSNLKDEGNILGFDIMNEPYGGSSGREIFKTLIANVKKVMFHDKAFHWGKFLSGLIPGLYHNLFDAFTREVLAKVVSSCDDIMIEFDKKYYMPFLNKVASSIREITNKGFITIDNNYFSNLGVETGLSPIVVNGIEEELQCFVPHAYDLMVDTPMYNYASNERVDFIFDKHLMTNERLKTPILVGEWGCSCMSGTRWHNHIKHLLDYFDDNEMSYIYWQFNYVLYSSRDAYMYMRPYVEAIDGEIISQKYDYETNTYTLKCRVNKSKDNLVLRLPLKPIVYDKTNVTSIIFNDEEKIRGIEEDFRHTILPMIIEQKWVRKKLMKYDMSELLDAQKLVYNLQEGENEIIIKTARSRTQIKKPKKKDLELYGYKSKKN